MTPASVPVSLESEEVVDQTILEFDWPASVGEINDIRVWALLTDSTTGELFGSYDMCEFSSR